MIYCTSFCPQLHMHCIDGVKRNLYPKNNLCPCTTSSKYVKRLKRENDARCILPVAY